MVNYENMVKEVLGEMRSEIAGKMKEMIAFRDEKRLDAHRGTDEFYTRSKECVMRMSNELSGIAVKIVEGLNKKISSEQIQADLGNDEVKEIYVPIVDHYGFYVYLGKSDIFTQRVNALNNSTDAERKAYVDKYREYAKKMLESDNDILEKVYDEELCTKLHDQAVSFANEGIKVINNGYCVTLSNDDYVNVDYEKASMLYDALLNYGMVAAK